VIRFVIIAIVSLSSHGAEIGCAETQGWKTALKTIYHYSPEPSAPEKPSLERTEGEMLYLEPMVVKLAAFRQDIEEATRRAEAAEKAVKFSPITGGLIFSKRLRSMDLKFGLWTKLVPVSSQAGIKKDVVGISVDVLKLDW
jgi:hypothetical protein